MALLSKTARELMRTSVDYVHPDDTLNKALQMLTDSQEVLVIEENGAYRGILTEQVIIRSGLDPSRTKVRSLLIHPPRITPDMSFIDVLRRIVESRIMHLPVMEEGRVVGIINDTILLEHARDDPITRDERVEACMTPDPHTIAPHETLARALSLFRHYGIHRLPVKEDGRIVGVVTLYDILRTILRPRDRPDYGTFIAEKERLIHLPVEDVMERNVISIHPDDSIHDAIVVLLERKRTGILVIDEKNTLRGIITRRDILSWLLARLQKHEAGVVIHLTMEKPLREEGESAVRDAAERFIQKYEDILGTGILAISVKRHRETFRGHPAIFTRVRLLTDTFRLIAHAHGWGYDQSVKNALRRIEDQIFSRKEYFMHLRKRKQWVEDWLAYYDIPSI